MRTDECAIALAGRTIDDPIDRIRRYCGVEWTGGPPETWAWRYYDLLPTGPTDAIDAVDVLAAGALHPGLTRAELAFFAERGDELTRWLADLPTEGTGRHVPASRLHTTTDDVLEHLGTLVHWADDVSLPLLTKVLHRKRPQLIPLLDRHLIEWYRPVTGQRRAVHAWRPILEAMRADLRSGEAALLLAIFDPSRETTPAEMRPSTLRLIDIAIWMGAQQRIEVVAYRGPAIAAELRTAHV